MVLFRPRLDILCGLLRAVGPVAKSVIIFLNSPLDASALGAIRAAAGQIVALGDGTNQGLGVAHTAIADRARANGARLLLIFDQDSSPLPNMVPRLLDARTYLVAVGERPAVVAPLAVSAREDVFKPPRLMRSRRVADDSRAWAAEFVISSGSMFDLDAIAEIGGFRADFFIDAIDIEWCFRAWARGYSCWIVPTAQMPHRLGDGIIRIPFLGIRLARQPPARLYTYVRNQIAMLRLAHTPLHWKLRLPLSILVQAVVYLTVTRGDRRFAKAFGFGVVDGLRQRLGPVRHDFG